MLTSGIRLNLLLSNKETICAQFLYNSWNWNRLLYELRNIAYNYRVLLKDMSLLNDLVG